MKTKGNEESAIRTREHRVHREIDGFLRALNSYADRFVHEPHLSFQQHFSSIIGADRSIADEEPRGQSR